MGAENPKAELLTLSGAHRPQVVAKCADSDLVGLGILNKAPGDAHAAGAQKHLEKCLDTGSVFRPDKYA